MKRELPRQCSSFDCPLPSSYSTGEGDQLDSDVFHAHDWMAAAVPAFVNASNKESTRKAKSILTIHNLEHQGFSSKIFKNVDFLGLLGMDGFEHHGQFNLLKEEFSMQTKLPQSARPMRRKFALLNMVADWRNL